MADPSRAALNWNALDASIIGAITEIQAARACIRHDAQSKATIKRNPNAEAQERFVRCFDDAQDMLDEVRAQMSIARSIFAGAPRIPSRPRQVTATALDRGNATYVVEPKKPASSRLETFKKRFAFFAKSSMRKFRKLTFASARRDNSIAVENVGKKTVSRREKLIVPFLYALPFSLRRRLWRNLKSSFAQTSPQGKMPSERTPYHNAFYPRPAFVLAAMVGLGVVASIAWAAWAPSTVSAANVGLSTPSIERSAVPAKGCSVSAWGKACYPRRSRL